MRKRNEKGNKALVQKLKIGFLVCASKNSEIPGSANDSIIKTNNKDLQPVLIAVTGQQNIEGHCTANMIFNG